MVQKKTTKDVLQDLLTEERSLKKEVRSLLDALARGSGLSSPVTQDASLQEAVSFSTTIEQQKQELARLSQRLTIITQKLERKEQECLSLNDQIASLRQEKLSVKQEADHGKISLVQQASRERILQEKIEELTRRCDALQTRKTKDIHQALDDVMKKDQQILEQGQQMITFKNLLREFEQRELRYKNEREVLEQNIKSRDDDIKALRQVLTEKVNRSKEEIAQYEKRSASYERITLDLRQNNERLLKDVETLNMQIKQLQEKIKERTFEAELIKKRDTLEKESHDDISLALYKSNKEIELLKQTILELTHKSRMRYTEEAKLLTQKNEDFDEKMRDLTAAHTKKQLELEYQIQELKQENQALKFDLNQIKEKERQMLENIKNQFNQLI